MAAQAGHPGLSRRHRLAERGIDGQLLLLLPAVVFVIGLFIYPFLYGLGLSFQPAKGGGPFADYQRFFTNARDLLYSRVDLDYVHRRVRVLFDVVFRIAKPAAAEHKRMLKIGIEVRNEVVKSCIAKHKFVTVIKDGRLSEIWIGRKGTYRTA